jgi:hypothetical protein
MEVNITSTRVEFLSRGRSVVFRGDDLLSGAVVQNTQTPTLPRVVVRLTLSREAREATGENFYDVDFRAVTNQPTWTTKPDTEGAFTCLTDLTPLFRKCCASGGASGDGTATTTDGLTDVLVIPAGTSSPLQESVIKYKDASDVDQETLPTNTEFDGVTLRPAEIVPRREIMNEGGTGTGLYATLDGLIADTIPEIPLTLFQTWAAGNADSLGVVLPAAYQGVAMSFVSETVANGTITVSVDNGSSFAAPPFTAAALKVIFRRTTTTNESTATFSS